jgi:hypothetical protein
MKRRLIVVFLLATALAGKAQATILTGTVRDAETSAPVAGAFVTLQIVNPDSISIPMISDAQGQFEALDVVTGNQIYVLMIAAQGYNPLYARLDALATQDISYEALLTHEPPPGPQPSPPDSGEFSGSVLTRGASQALVPVSGASVVLTSGATQIEVHSDAQGRYASALLPLGTYSVQFRAAGFSELVIPSVDLAASQMVLDGVLSANPTAVVPKTWGSVKATYR